MAGLTVISASPSFISCRAAPPALGVGVRRIEDAGSCVGGRECSIHSAACRAASFFDNGFRVGIAVGFVVGCTEGGFVVGDFVSGFVLEAGAGSEVGGEDGGEVLRDGMSVGVGVGRLVLQCDALKATRGSRPGESSDDFDTHIPL